MLVVQKARQGRQATEEGGACWLLEGPQRDGPHDSVVPAENSSTRRGNVSTHAGKANTRAEAISGCDCSRSGARLLRPSLFY